MSARDDILDEVRRHQLSEILHPGEFTAGTVYEDPVAHYETSLTGVGGRLELPDSAAAATSILESIPEYASATKRVSCVDGVGQSNFDLAGVTDPHDLQDVDYAVLPGRLAVAENAAVWVTTPDVCIRTLYFLTQHLALVVPRGQVVSNMHEAYQQIDVTEHPFGTWISGPSKTADIEQSLVKGAHGSRSLLVMFLNE